jgi:hypothetical protein
MNHTPTKKKDDMPLPAALVLLGVVIFLLVAGKDASNFANEMQGLAPVVERNLGFLTVALISGSFSLAWIAAKYRRLVKLTQQGSRLQSLLGRPGLQKIGFMRQVALTVFAGTATFLCSLLLLDDTGIRIPMTKFQREVWGVIETGAAVTMAIAVATLFFAIHGTKLWKAKVKNGGVDRIPPFPALPNAIALGTEGEGDTGRDARWMSLNTRALNGNILITGSIGCGKTQGTILPYFQQLLTSFSPSPAVLAIDPKGTFVPVAKKIIDARRLTSHCLHLCLDGNFRFNPIFHQDALRGARFLDIAYMVKAAGTNFMGRSSDSAFWEMSSFNLIKNALVYCAAVYDYYTLIELYDVMLRAVDDGLPEKLQKAMDEKVFDKEQKFNVMCAYEYFSLEFKQLEEKVRTGILATATSFLNQFQEYRASRIFCPKRDEQSIQSLDEVVDGGMILLFDISSPALAKSMGTIIKLLYQQSLLDRLKDTGRDKNRIGVLLVDEYQDVVTTGHGTSVGDERFLAKSREANTISIMATQSLTSLQNSIGKEDSARELFQNFRTRIAGHSSDLATIKSFQELVGQEDREKLSHSLSELSQDARKNYMLGGFEANNANISESVSKSTQREFIVTGKEFSALSTFECFALIYDGVRSSFHKIFLKPYFLEDKAEAHSQILRRLAPAALTLALGVLGQATLANSFPNICSVVRSSYFTACMEYSVGACTCGFPPHPCAQFNYYVPTSFVEVHPNPGETFFGDLPAARGQLSSLSATLLPYGAEADSDTQSFHAHTLSIPLASLVMGLLPCRLQPRETTCFEAMSEHLGTLWTTGAADQFQPNFLAWMATPKACLLVGAAKSLAGGEVGVFSSGSPMCSVPMGVIPRFPPSAHFACNGWGVFYPRTGVCSGPSQTAGALMVASRIKSLASEVFHSTPSFPDEKWQMITPQSSACFREGENVLPLETFKRATEIRRLAGAPPTGHLFAIWQRVSCCSEVIEVASGQAVLAAIKASCAAGGDL